jgi:endonuclease YncB( thermonuclease family)
MPPVRKKSIQLVPILILITAIALWLLDSYKLLESQPPRENPPALTQGKSSHYETYPACTLVTDKSNDGDSFRVLLPDGRKEIIRLYFVDTPESSFKNYGNGQNNRQRIAQQAAALNNITPEQAVEIGKKARDYTISLLTKTPFTLHTKWHSPYNDQRYHGFIEINDNGKNRFLHELLVAKGLARIHTKGAILPDGTSQATHKKHLLDLQQTAKSSNFGVWSL